METWLANDLISDPAKASLGGLLNRSGFRGVCAVQPVLSAQRLY